MPTARLDRHDVDLIPCTNEDADAIFSQNYWMARQRRSRRISYSASYHGTTVAWIQCADPFGTKLARPLQVFDINDAVELSRGFFLEDAPENIESCVIGKVLRQTPNDWFSRFGAIKRLAIVYQDLDAGQRGIVYAALGFIPYGICSRARHHSMPTRGNSRGRKILWARALRRVNATRYDTQLPPAPTDLSHLTGPSCPVTIDPPQYVCDTYNES